MSRFPEGKQFAFTVFDDTDGATVENVEPVYALLADLGLRTTKSVWPLPEVAEGQIGGSSLADGAYRAFIRRLQQLDFEIAIHNVRNHDADRDTIQGGLDLFVEHVGHYPRVHANHMANRDNLYWGPDRFTSRSLRFAYNLLTRYRRHNRFHGHRESSPFFWGDICHEHITYVRNFVFDEINLDRVNPTMPYVDPEKPFVRYWFSSSEGRDVESFCRMIGEENQDRLEEEEGVCIMYTHFVHDFYRDGWLHPRFEALMRRLAKKGGWFVPVSELLDHLRRPRDDAVIPVR